MVYDNLLNLAKRVQSISDVGLLYSGHNPYDKERYEELQAIALELMHELTNTPIPTLREAFPAVRDYPTAKVDIRGLALSAEGEVLLVKESADGRWSLPGGWADIGYTPKETVVKEFREETGFEVIPVRLLAVFDKKMHPHPPQAHYVYKMVFLCQITGGAIHQAFDVQEVKFFAPTNLPTEFSEDRILRQQIALLLKIAKDETALPYCD
jgi:ADP-ribose pyrophosphatase YjhB (NUDIX family)